MSNKHTGKVAVVTGASRGIGAAIAKHLAAEGAAVVVNYAASAASADQVVSEITEAGGRAVAIQADLTIPAQIERLFVETRAAFGELDILVNNAGNYAFAPLGEITPEHFHKQYDLNVLGLLLTTQEALKCFRAEGGSVINISSLASAYTGPGQAVYAGTKAAVDAMTKVMSKELGSRQIRVNSLNPGVIESGDPTAIAESDRREMLALTPLGRLGSGLDVAQTVSFLASPDSSWMTGQVIYLSGGMR